MYSFVRNILDAKAKINIFNFVYTVLLTFIDSLILHSFYNWKILYLLTIEMPLNRLLYYFWLIFAFENIFYYCDI